MGATAVAVALREACLLELEALKPGNVHRYAVGHGMTLADFETSAETLNQVFSRSKLTVGERIYRAVAATRGAVGCNTNLGIVLLAAPLAEAALRTGTAGLRRSLGSVLEA